LRSTRGSPGLPSMRTANTLAKIATISTPTLVIAADADLLAPPALMRFWAAHLKTHEWVVVQDAGHAMAWEHQAHSTIRFLNSSGAI
jgi:pimeloyl-ACP methyl ester carboxylesterase